MLPQPTRNLHSADILTLSVVGAALANQDFIPILQCFYGCYALHGTFQKSFIPRHENGKGCQWNVQRCILADLGKCLTVRNDHGRLFCQTFQGGFQCVFLRYHRNGIRFQQIPNGLLLGQNEPSFRSRTVDGCHQHHQIFCLYQISYQHPFLLVLFTQCGNAFFQFFNACFFQRADCHFVFF